MSRLPIQTVDAQKIAADIIKRGAERSFKTDCEQELQYCVVVAYGNWQGAVLSDKGHSDVYNLSLVKAVRYQLSRIGFEVH